MMRNEAKIITEYIKNISRWFAQTCNKSISRRITILFVPLIVMVIISISLISYFKFSDTLQKQVINDTGKIIEQVGKNTDFYFKDIMTPMAMLVRNPNVIRALKDYNRMDTKDKLFLDRDIKELTSNINIFKSYLGDLLIVGKNGFTVNLASSPSLIADYDFMRADWMQDVIMSDEDGIHYISPHQCDYYYPSVKPYNMSISAVLPVKQDKLTLGYIICDINLKGLNSIFDTLKLVEGGIVYMVDEEGRTVFHPDLHAVGSSADPGIVRRVSGESNGSFKYKNREKEVLIVYSRSPRTGWVLVAEIPYENIRRPALDIFNVVLLILTISIIFVIFISFLISLQIKRPLNDLVKRMQSVEKHDFNSYQKDFGYGEIGFLRSKFEGMVSEINTLINDVYVSKVRQREAEFEALQNQINPHFIYNALQLVKAEAVFADHTEISRIVTSLGYLMRYAMNTRHETAKISEEIQYIRNYLEIYKKRFEDRFTYGVDVDQDLLECKVPKLILQPIVENCLKHGLSHVKTGGEIQIAVNKAGSSARFEVFDNGTGFSDEELSMVLNDVCSDSAGRSIGLKNVNSRLKLKYGENSTLQIFSEKDKYTKVVFHIRLDSLY